MLKARACLLISQTFLFNLFDKNNYRWSRNLRVFYYYALFLVLKVPSKLVLSVIKKLSENVLNETDCRSDFFFIQCQVLPQSFKGANQSV